mmetsp:Transcript_29345/g.47385  ORF Transcript_29345/g.47385 Transcript_29345/m.47385 type:complete len:269 (-) Transcript_29345:479-1285(-)|eukprot:CAMPEP_0184660248 /NCGR_PEP_ID=MMETSP0308-20130426/33032_1 /TAXON_ID=38269 /ORGANISM="Gloeochaete witrockiana, Strain SAG 46.84" /LENGTH=268 /DNA_ID=CAMNT_0027100683 /DNA_START=212 /DNA_END=1018 /DNA_ORIENTATION=+
MDRKQAGAFSKNSKGTSPRSVPQVIPEESDEDSDEQEEEEEEDLPDESPQKTKSSTPGSNRSGSSMSLRPPASSLPSVLQGPVAAFGNAITTPLTNLAMDAHSMAKQAMMAVDFLDVLKTPEERAELALQRVDDDFRSQAQGMQASFVRNVEYKKMFNLASVDNLVAEYPCALQRSILLQGQLFVFSKHIGFKSTLFGVQTIESFALADVEAIHKRNTALFVPNAIELILNNKQSIMFTSFLKRDDAYNMIAKMWNVAKHLQKLQAKR